MFTEPPSKERCLEIAHLLAEANKVTLEASVLIHGKPSQRKLRDEFKSGERKLNDFPEVRKSLYLLESLETETINAFCRLGHNFCKTMYKSCKMQKVIVEFEDFQQEVKMAVYDAMYTYDGSTLISTYVVNCIRNRLLSFMDQNKRRCWIESQESTFQLDFNAEWAADLPEKLPDENFDLMAEAIKTCPLDPREQIVMNHYMTGKPICAAPVMHKTKNVPVSRQAVSLIFIRCCRKLKDHFMKLQAA